MFRICKNLQNIATSRTFDYPRQIIIRLLFDYAYRNVVYQSRTLSNAIRSIGWGHFNCIVGKCIFLNAYPLTRFSKFRSDKSGHETQHFYLLIDKIKNIIVRNIEIHLKKDYSYKINKYEENIIIRKTNHSCLFILTWLSDWRNKNACDSPDARQMRKMLSSNLL